MYLHTLSFKSVCKSIYDYLYLNWAPKLFLEKYKHRITKKRCFIYTTQQYTFVKQYNMFV